MVSSSIMNICFTNNNFMPWCSLCLSACTTVFPLHVKPTMHIPWFKRYQYKELWPTLSMCGLNANDYPLAYIIRCHYCKRSPIAEILKCACWNWWNTAFSFKGASWKKLAMWLVSSSLAYSLHCSHFIKLCSLSSPFTFSPWTMSVTWRTFTVSWFPSLHFHPFLDSCAPDTVFSYLLDICIPQTVCEPNWIP